MSNHINDAHDDGGINSASSLISECCGAISLGETFESHGVISGICQGCRDHATFTQEIEEE
jgi:hypothetical protein